MAEQPITTRECDLRHEPLDLFMNKLDKKQDRLSNMLIVGLFLIILNIGVIVGMRFV